MSTTPREGASDKGGKKGDKWPRKVTVGNVSVKVYRQKHETSKTGWTYVLVTYQGGVRKREKFSDPDEAIAEGRLKAGQLNAGRVEGASMSRSDRDELQEARKLAGATPLLTALQEWARANDLTQGHVLAAAQAWKARNVAEIGRHKVADVVDGFCRAKTAAGFNVADDHSSIFEAIKKDLGEQNIDTVSAKALDTWLAKRENPVSRNTYRKRIVSVWRWAQKRGYLPRDVRTEAEQTERAREEAPPIGIITPETFAKSLELVRAKEPRCLAVAAIAGFTGLRRAELHGQTWEDIDLEGKFLRVTRAKRGTPARRLVPLCDAAIAWLNLCEDHEGPICHGYAFDVVRRVGREAGLELPENCYRHGYISHRVAQTGNVAETSLEAGNSPKIIHAHYRELVSKKQGEAWFLVAPA